jgi:hypothetical protein
MNSRGKIEFHLEDDKTLRIMAGWTVILSEKEWRDYLDRFDYSDNGGFSVNDNVYKQNGTNFYMHEEEIVNWLCDEFGVKDIKRVGYVHLDKKDHNEKLITDPELIVKYGSLLLE